MPVEERFLTVIELEEALNSGKLEEAFGTGTAATVAFIRLINIHGKDYELKEVAPTAFSVRILEALDNIKYGKVEDKYNWISKY